MTQFAAAIDLVGSTARIAGLAGVAGGSTLLVAAAYRWYAREAVPEGLAVLVGLTVVAVYLNTTVALAQVMQGAGAGLLDLDGALVNGATFLAAVGASLVGRRVGDRFGTTLGDGAGDPTVETGVGRLGRVVGRVQAVTLPGADDIEDIEGYDPVAPATREGLAGATLYVPRGLTTAELEDRLVARLKEDYAVGHVGIQLAADGTVEYLGVGSRASGIGPTLAPGTAATAVRADPAFSASPGDAVQLWRQGAEPELVATAELRAAVEDVVTLALDEPEAAGLDPEARYRLLTLPADPRVENEFASLLRSADETMGVVTVAAGGGLVGRRLGDLDPTVIAVRAADGEIVAIPSRERTLEAGDAVYAIARPEVLRRLEAAGAG